jgi:hypothetical protein
VEVPVVGGVLCDPGDLVCGNIAGEGLALFPALQVVIGAVGAVGDDTELAGFHVLDLGDLLEDLGWSGLVHGMNIYLSIYLSTKKRPSRVITRMASRARDVPARQNHLAVPKSRLYNVGSEFVE